MTCPPILTFDYDSFIAVAPAYSNITLYPEDLLQQYWNNAINYVSDISTQGNLQCTGRQYAINLMVAHLVYIAGLIAIGQVPGLMQNATIDKVTVGLTPPPLKNQWQWWLSVSPYGGQLLALLQVNSVGGQYIGLPGTGLAGFGLVPNFGQTNFWPGAGRCL
jgi:hypothetical protein